MTSHRENSLTPWITNDPASYGKRSGYVYDDLGRCIGMTKVDVVEHASHGVEIGKGTTVTLRSERESNIQYLRRVLGDDMRPVQEQLAGPPRKRIARPVCHGKDVACLPGKSGKCVACADDD